jgi:8-hydroxy-5-deazaflavin:NADPH oxidoreductase
MKIAILGTGSVGRALAARLAELEYDVMIGTRNVSEKLASTAKDMYGNPPFNEWIKTTGSKIKLGTFSDAAAFGELIINATNGNNSIKALILAGSRNLAGKVLLDIANPLDFSNGAPALLPGLNNTHSLAEEIQNTFPDVMVVKSLNTIAASLMVDPSQIGNGDHVIYICGNKAEAKGKVEKLLYQFGWKKDNIIDLGDITGARAAESILPIWIRLMGTLKTGIFNFRIVR